MGDTREQDNKSVLLIVQMYDIKGDSTKCVKQMFTMSSKVLMITEAVSRY